MDWKLLPLELLKGFLMVLLFFFLIMSGWLLHIVEAIAGSVVKSKKKFNKKAMGAGTVASLVAKPIHRYSLKGRRAIQGYLVGHYSYGKYIRKVV